MELSDHGAPLQIKKYPNRRYYDTTRSRHVTLHDVYDLVRAGYDVVITDSRNGDDITNLILLQVMLERDVPKLDILPSALIHLMIRANPQVLRTSVDRLFGPFMGMIASSQRQFDTYLRQAISGKFMSPLDWASTVMQAFQPQTHPGDPDAAPPQDAEPGEADPESLDDLRLQIAALNHRLGELVAARNGSREGKREG